MPAPWSPADVEPLAAVIGGALVALDFDGTLAPIVRDPEDSRPVAGALAAAQALAAVGARVALVTGREAAVVLRLSGFDAVPGVSVDGVYGAQRYRDGRLNVSPTPPAMTAARGEIEAVLTDAGADPKVWVEDKDISFVVHTRLAQAADAQFARVQGPVTALARHHGLEVHPGKQVLEVRVPGVDKGRALGALLDALDPAGLLWAGDDLGDVPAFERLREWRAATGRPALGVAVAPGPSPDPLSGDGPPPELEPAVADVADVVAAGPDDLVRLLARLTG